MANAQPTIVDKVKLALRITHNLLDAEIADVVASARQELIRAGVASDIANGDKKIIETALKTYALWYYAEPKDRDGYYKSFESQCENLRKSTFEEEGGDNV